MGKKYFFFDIDGTLTTKNPGGDVPESTLRTLDLLKEKGHVVAIATGRAEHSARDFRRQCKIDYMVHNGGNGITIKDEVIYIKPLPYDKALALCLECLEKEIPFGVSLDNSSTTYTHTSRYVEARNMPDSSMTIVVDEKMDYRQLKEIHKIFVAIPVEREHELVHLKKLGHARYFPTFLHCEPDDKVQGIKDMVEYLGGSFEDVVVFGDGRNDLTMIKAAPISIAMGNAIDEVKKAATFITKRSDEDGIEYACQYFGWI